MSLKPPSTTNSRKCRRRVGLRRLSRVSESAEANTLVSDWQGRVRLPRDKVDDIYNTIEAHSGGELTRSVAKRNCINVGNTTPNLNCIQSLNSILHVACHTSLQPRDFHYVHPDFRGLPRFFPCDRVTFGVCIDLRGLKLRLLSEVGEVLLGERGGDDVDSFARLVCNWLLEEDKMGMDEELSVILPSLGRAIGKAEDGPSREDVNISCFDLAESRSFEDCGAIGSWPNDDGKGPKGFDGITR